MTPAGRLWLERQASAGANLEDASTVANPEGNHGAQHLPENVRTALVEAIREATQPPSNLVKLAWGLAVVVLGAMVILLLKRHLEIPL